MRTAYVHPEEGQRSLWSQGKFLEGHSDFLQALFPACVDFSRKCGKKQEVLEQLSSPAQRSGVIEDRGKLLEDLLEREAAQATGVGEGIAIPHAHSPAVGSPCVAVLRLKEPVSFGGWDGIPAQLLFLIATPEGCFAQHIRLLSHIAKLLMLPGYISRLFSADSPEELLDCLLAGEKTLLLSSGFSVKEQTKCSFFQGDKKIQAT